MPRADDVLTVLSSRLCCPMFHAVTVLQFFSAHPYTLLAAVYRNWLHPIAILADNLQIRMEALQSLGTAWDVNEHIHCLC
jgi:hypothetical protein